jgi:hypothetical protein
MLMDNEENERSKCKLQSIYKEDFQESRRLSTVVVTVWLAVLHRVQEEPHSVSTGRPAILTQYFMISISPSKNTS